MQNSINAAWYRLKNVPCGKFMFSKLLGRLIPYTGSISSIVLEIDEGHSLVKLKDRRKVRNSYGSIHAIALANLGELATGLSLFSQLSNNAIAILVNLDVNYLKKAHGTLLAEANFKLPKLKPGDSQLTIQSNIKNTLGEIVCEVSATWQVRTKPLE